MLLIQCPVCGERDHTDFTYGGDASLTRPGLDERSLEPWLDYVFQRNNPRGWHLEYWHHVNGCRQWLIVERNTVTHEIRSALLAQAVRGRTPGKP